MKLKILMTLFTRRHEGTFFRAFPWATFLVSRGHDVTIACTSDKHLFRSAGRKLIPVLIAAWCEHYGKGGFREYEYSPYRLRRFYKWAGLPFQALMDHLEGALRRRADAATVISTYLRQRAVNLGVAEEKIRLIPGSAETALIQPRSSRLARNKLGLDENQRYALFLGAGQFDIDFSLAAFSLILRQLPDARFIIVGKKDMAVTRKAA